MRAILRASRTANKQSKCDAPALRAVLTNQRYFCHPALVLRRAPTFTVSALFAIAVIAALLCSCEATHPTPAERKMFARSDAALATRNEFDRPRPFEVSVESEPPGAVIEVNEDMLGRAPCTIRIEGNANRIMSRLTTVSAIPTAPGDFVQLKFINNGDRIPERMYFNMHLRHHQTPQIDVRVDQ